MGFLQNMCNFLRGEKGEPAPKEASGQGGGFKTQKVVHADQPEPLITAGGFGGGGVQGIWWYVKRLLVDEDGFVAEQFLEEQVGAAVRVLNVVRRADWRHVQIHQGNVLRDCRDYT
mmetsp:Transcript_45893/g.87600  ORF Transcript_45893/g.87600 Transcript_45893/m.87600 type:complete len:116 (+) Transcript_45893:398-745(+)